MTKNKGLPPGRPSKYHTHVQPRLGEIEDWAVLRMTQPDMARELGVAYSSFMEYKNQFTELSDTIQRGWNRSGEFVESQFFKKIKGTKLTETKYERQYDPGSNSWEMVAVETKVKEVAPDTTALIFALKNHLPERYADKSETVLSGSVDTAVKHMTDEEIQKQIDEYRKKAGLT